MRIKFDSHQSVYENRLTDLNQNFSPDHMGQDLKHLLYRPYRAYQLLLCDSIFTLFCGLLNSQPLIQNPANIFLPRGGFLVQRSIREVLLKWVAKLASWYDDDPLFSAKTGINIGHIFKIFWNWCKNRPNFINLIPKFLKFAWKLLQFGKIMWNF